MPTSLISTGVQFPDNSIQTTAAGASGGDYIMNAYVAPATWTKPAGLKAIKVTVVGAGGNGGTAVNPSPAGAVISASGGGGGGAAIEYLDAPAIPGPVAVTAGPGTNSFGAFCSATAGAAGAINSPGGAGGAGSGGTFNIKGGGGGASVLAEIGGAGGSSILGGGGEGRYKTPGVAPGFAGGDYGGGGGGAVRNGPGPATPNPAPGGAGAPGIVIVEEFY